ncbi:MAG TPA: nodulation protein NfeD [Vicinamibacterales bacterium]|nr:nodulation protein NfeD [Vicinamibacterales bacterium]
MNIRRQTAAACLVAGGAMLVGSAIAGRGQQETLVAYVAEVDGIIHPVAVQYLQGAIARADAAGAAILVITLRTPGGLVDSTRDINTAIIQARTPVAVFVGPAGGRAASAGFLITIAADVAAMAPGTHIGAAHPVAGDGQKVDDTMSKKMTSDVASYAKTLATQRKRNVELVEQAVTESRSFTDKEALAARPPLIDVVAKDVPDLLRQLDGRTITRFDGRSETLHTAGATMERVDMTWAQRFLSALAHPQIAYLLLTLGTLGLTIELWNPGAILPGVVGGICLLLAFFAFQVLPVSYAAVGLLMFGVVLLILEVKVTSFGLLATGGIISLLLGSMMLIDSPLPELQVGASLVVPVTLAVSALILFLVRLGVQAQRRRAVTGEEGMIGRTGQAVTAIEPGKGGSVQTFGEIWTATAPEPISAGEIVRVVGLDGLVLTVRPVRSGVAAAGQLTAADQTTR